MGYDIHLINKANKSVEVPLHKVGGTFIEGGNTRAELSITFNYLGFFNFKSLDRKVSGNTIRLLEILVEEFGTERDENYWKATSGNVGYMCSILLEWARLHPEAVWKVMY